MISIVVPVWNRKRFVIETIESVLAQTYKDFELILVDDGSTDGVIEVMEEYAKKDKRVKVLKQKHSGCTDAWNKGYKAAEGDVICVLGSDDLWLPNKLERQVEVAKDYPDYILHNNSISIDEHGAELTKTVFFDNDIIEYKERALGDPSPWFMTSSWFVPKYMFDKVGLFEGIYNDYQWLMRAILLHDMKMKLIPEYLTKHRSNPDSNTYKLVGQKRFRQLAIEIQKEIKEEMGEDKILDITSSSNIKCSRCGKLIPRICPVCNINLRKKENLICKFGMDYKNPTPNHCFNCWRKKQ